MSKISKNKKILTSLLLVLTIAIVGYFSYKYWTNNQLAKTTSKSETAQNDYSSGPKRDTATNEGTSQGGATDNQGKLPDGSTQPDSSKATTSESGNIVLATPYAGSELKNGDTVAGTAKTDKVQYRLIDNSVGVIGQGSLSVVNGSFSGTLHFNAHSSTGQLEVFSYDAQTGAEINRIEIDIEY